MQNLIVGKSGSGKGYEVCAFHILSALSQGRKVITNMPLVLEKWGAIDPSFPALIEMRKRAMPIRGTWEPTREEGAYNLFSDDSQIIFPPPTARVFAGVWDYYSTWRHPKTGTGPLFVVDEAQNVIPRGKTAQDVEEWSALHRHFVNDVLFMTQSYGKLSQAIRDNIQMVYRLTKKVAWGQPNKYIRKVQDGIRGEVLNVTERTYNPAFFGLWVSQTQGGSGEEFSADDIMPFWKHWTFMGAGFCALLVLCIAIFGSTGKKSPVASAPVPIAHPVPQSVSAPQPPPIEAQPRGPQHKMHPYDGSTMHLQGIVYSKLQRDGKEIQYLTGYVAIAQNGQPVTRVTFTDLRTAGYDIEYRSPTVISVGFKGYDVGYVIADLPQVSMSKSAKASVAAN